MTCLRAALALLLVLPGLLPGQDQRLSPLAGSPLAGSPLAGSPLAGSPLAGSPLAAAGGEMVPVDEFEIDVYEFPNQRGMLPRVDVSWTEAAAACAAQGKRLCTEHEWRQACAGPEGLAYGYGRAFEPGRCNTRRPTEDGWRPESGLTPSGEYANCVTAAGAHDMIGNAWEWTADRYVPDQEWRVVRGGSWYHNVNMATSEYRYGRYLTPDYRSDLIGFRCCRSRSGAASSSP